MAKNQNTNSEKKFMTWQILRKGNYYNGQITDEMMKELVETFGQNGEIPIGIGHISSFFDDSLPAEGWIDPTKEFGIDAKGNFTAKGVYLFEPLASLYAEGRYKNWSAVIARPRKYNAQKDSFEYGKWELRAVDMLGRATPAIKNLKDITANARQATLNKFSIDEKAENVIKFADSGDEMEVLHFSFSENLEPEKTQEHSDKNEEVEKMNEYEKKLAEFSAKMEEQNKAFAEREAAREAEIKKLSDENKAIKEAGLKKIADTEKKLLSEALTGIPEEMKTKLFSAIDASVPLSSFEMSFGEAEEKESFFSILATAIKHIRKTDSEGYFSEMPDVEGNKQEMNVYSNSGEMTRKMFG